MQACTPPTQAEDDWDVSIATLCRLTDFLVVRTNIKTHRLVSRLQKIRQTRSPIGC